MCVAMGSLHLDRVLIPQYKDCVCVCVWIMDVFTLLQIFLLDLNNFFTCLLQKGIMPFTTTAKN